jgi:O-acetyl-ADP-ribose deacetylase (regulator of RNase III)
MFVVENKELAGPKYIINFPTKRHWKGKSKIEDIDSGLKSLASEIERLDIKSIAIPPLGSGLGGLSWSTVRPLMEQRLSGLHNVAIIIYEPGFSPPQTTVDSQPLPALTRGRALLLVLIDQYLSACMDTSVTLLEIHKLLYLLQNTGEDLRLRYVKAEYGPYAENLKFVLKAMENYYITGYSGASENPRQEIELIPRALQDASEFLCDERDAVIRIETVSKVIEGFETAFGLEPLTTVHWVANAVHSWNARKSQFPDGAIEKAIERLSDSNLIALAE